MAQPRIVWSVALSVGLFATIAGVGAFQFERDKRVWTELELQEAQEELHGTRFCLSLYAAEARALRFALEHDDFPGDGKSVIQVHECKGFLLMQQY